VIVSTHDLNFAASICRDLVLLQNGMSSHRADDACLDRAPVRQLLTAVDGRQVPRRGGGPTSPVVPLEG